MTIQSRSVFFAFLCFISGSLQAAIIPFTNQHDWRLALPGLSVLSEDFSGSATTFSANSSGNTLGLISLSLIGGAGDPGPTGLTGGGFFQGEVDATGSDELSLKFSFVPTSGFALTGLQNDSLSTPFNLALEELALGIGADYWLLNDLGGSPVGSIPFLGFVSDQPLDSFTLFHAARVSSISTTSEEFYLDGFSLAVAPSVVAEPPILMILMAALPAFVGVIRLRRRNKSFSVEMFYP